jgi:hypothetical protein
METWYNPAARTRARLLLPTRIRTPTLSADHLQRAVLLAVVAVALCGCGAGRDPLNQAVSAARKTLALSGVNYDLTLGGPRLFGRTPTLARGRAVYDFRAGLGYEKLVFQRAQDRAPRNLYLDFLPTKFLFAPSTPPSGVQVGTTWISVPLTGPQAARTSPGLVAQIEGLTPELALDEIAWGARAASFGGQRVVNHVPMDEYSVSVDLARALAEARKARKGAIAAAIESQIAASHASGPRGRPGYLTINLWVNGPGYVAGLEGTVPGSGLGKTSFSLSHFGVKVPRNLPLASQTVPLASLSGPGESLRSPWIIASG